MIVGGILICVGLWFSSAKAQAYTAWCDKKAELLGRQILLQQRMAADAAIAEHEYEYEEAEPAAGACEGINNG